MLVSLLLTCVLACSNATAAYSRACLTLSDLPDRDEEDDDVGDGIGRGGFCLELQLSVYAKFSLSAPPFFCQLASQIVLEEIEVVVVLT